MNCKTRLKRLRLIQPVSLLKGNLRQRNPCWIYQTDLASFFQCINTGRVGKRDDDELIFVEPAKTTQHLSSLPTWECHLSTNSRIDRYQVEGYRRAPQSNLDQFRAEEEILFAEIVDQFEGVTYFAATQQGSNQALWTQRNWAHGGLIVLNRLSMLAKDPRRPYRSSCSSCSWRYHDHY